jgi:glycosyltransferase involved in cell wall biosynthesis
VLARCRDAQAYCVPCLESKRELIESGCPPARVHLIADGIQPVQLRESFTRADARHALADINHDLQVPPDAPVVVCAGSLSERRGLKSLVSAWPAVLTQLPTARLWLIGDGPLRVELHQLRNDLEIGHAVHLPGTFDDLDGVLRAADLLVDPTAGQPESQTVLQAVTARLPLVLATPAANGSVLRDDHTRRCEASDPTALSRAIIDGLQFPPDAAALSAARSRVLQQHDLGRMIRRYAELFQSVAAGSR